MPVVANKNVQPLSCVRNPGKQGTKKSASEVVTASYNQYIQSPKWERKRQQRLDLAGDRCELCNRSSNLHVHHRTYERFGEERISDLIVLCRTCHDAFHDRLALHSAPVDGAPEVEGRTLETLVDRGENHHSHAEPISTGFDKIDSVTGLRPATLNVVGARPGMRGRFLAYQFVLNAQERDASTTGMILTAREPVERLSERLLCADAKVSWHRMLEGKLGEEESERLIASKRKQADLHLINSRGWSIGELREEVQAYRRRHNVDMVVIDGFEDIQPPDPNTEWFYQASIIAAELKTLALRWAMMQA